MSILRNAVLCFAIFTFSLLVGHTTVLGIAGWVLAALTAAAVFVYKLP